MNFEDLTPPAMARLDVARRRLNNERLVGTPFAKPEDVVRWLGAVQAQDYAGAKWAIAQRTQGCTDADVEEAFQSGKIVRTHVMRPTWHFVMPADVRWMLELTAPRVNAASAYYYRKMELEGSTFRRSNVALAKALQGGKHLTRQELGRVLKDAGIVATGLRLILLMMRAELDAVICSGPRRGKQFTYALLDERVPATRRLQRDESLARLTERYFTSHGPSLLQDFAWWSGLTVADSRKGTELCKHRLTHEVSDGKTYWFAPAARTAGVKNPIIHLLPNYDEYLVAYKDHSPSLDAALVKSVDPRYRVLDNHIVVMHGKVIGGWRRTIEKNAVIVRTRLLAPLNKSQRRALQVAAEHYGRFLGLPVRLLRK